MTSGVNRSHLPLLLIGLLFVAFRILSCIVVDFPPNSAPLAALFFASTLLAGRNGVILSTALFLLSYPLLSLLQGYPVGTDLLTSLLGFGLIVGIATMAGKLPCHGFIARLTLLLGGSIISAALFYFLTNTFSWWILPFYDKTATGFYYAQWGQHPSLAQPTWHFLRNSLIGNTCFISLLTLAQLRGTALVKYERNSPMKKNLSV